MTVDDMRIRYWSADVCSTGLTEALGRFPDMREYDRGRGARDPRHAVMLGDPIAFIAQRLGMPGEIGSVGEGLRDRAGIGDGHEVEEREFRHATDMRWGRPWFNHPTSSFPRRRESDRKSTRLNSSH